MSQHGLFDDDDQKIIDKIKAAHDRPFSEPTTSREAAESMRPTAATLRANVYNYIKAQGKRGATDEEVQHALKMSANTQRPRRWELEKGGYIIRTSAKRKTLAGRNASVFVEASHYGL